MYKLGILNELDDSEFVDDFIEYYTLKKLSKSKKLSFIEESKKRQQDFLNKLSKKNDRILKLNFFVQKFIDQMHSVASVATLKEYKKEIVTESNALKVEQASLNKENFISKARNNKKRLLLQLIDSELQDNLNRLNIGNELSNKWETGSSVGFGLSVATTIVVMFFSTLAQFLANVPVINFVATPLKDAFNYLGYLLWWKSIQHDSKTSEAEKKFVKKHLDYIQTYNSRAAVSGMVGGVAMAVALVASGIAVPIVLGIATIALAISNTLWTAACFKELDQERKYSKDNAGKPYRVKAQAANCLYASFSTIGSTCLALGATLGVATLFFPPLAAAVAGIFATIGIIFVAVSVASYFASKYYSHKAEIVTKQEESQQLYLKKTDKTIRQEKHFLNAFSRENSLKESVRVTPASTEKQSVQSEPIMNRLVTRQYTNQKPTILKKKKSVLEPVASGAVRGILKLPTAAHKQDMSFKAIHQGLEKLCKKNHWSISGTYPECQLLLSDKKTCLLINNNEVACNNPTYLKAYQAMAKTLQKLHNLQNLSLQDNEIIVYQPNLKLPVSIKKECEKLGFSAMETNNIQEYLSNTERADPHKSKK